MINTSSGGDGTPSPPERVKVVEPATTEAADHRFPEKNPSGSEELEKLRVTENKETMRSHFTGQKIHYLQYPRVMQIEKFRMWKCPSQ
jgi:hypothetical protein